MKNVSVMIAMLVSVNAMAEAGAGSRISNANGSLSFAVKPKSGGGKVAPKSDLAQPVSDTALVKPIYDSKAVIDSGSVQVVDKVQAVDKVDASLVESVSTK